MVYWGSTRALILWYLLCSLAEISRALQCKPDLLGLARNCPDDFSDKSFCCERDSGVVYCCDFDDFVKLNSGKYFVPVAIGIVIAIVVGCVMCCLCCPCCMLYKRRHRGTVYGRVQQPAAVVTVQPTGPVPPIVSLQGNIHMPNTMPMPMQSHAAPNPAYPSGQHSMPPPPYSAVSNEGYAKQAPYNPNFYNN